MEKMTVNIDKIAKSAAISVKEGEKEIFQSQIESIVEMLCQLKTVDTSNVEPLMSVYQGCVQMRADVAIDPKSEETVMSSSNNSRYGYFITPKFVD